MSIKLLANCPKCKQEQLTLDKNIILCSGSNCHFFVCYLCPICDHEIDKSNFSTDSRGNFFTCQHCRSKMHNQKIAQLLNNKLYVSKEIPCIRCNRPTIHHKHATIGHRCIMFPKCSGQTSLLHTSNMQSIVFLDLETTGLDASKNEIIEIGAIKIDEDGFEDNFQYFIKPSRPVSEKISSITGITNEMLSQANAIDSILPKLNQFIGSSTIVAHNAEFDLPWLILHNKRLNIFFPKNTIICTLKWARQLGEKRASLTALTKKYHIFHEDAHRALQDAMATKELFFVFNSLKRNAIPIIDFSHFESICEKFHRASGLKGIATDEYS